MLPRPLRDRPPLGVASRSALVPVAGPLVTLREDCSPVTRAPAPGRASQRRDATLHFASAAGPIAVTVCSPRIVRVALGASPTPEHSFVVPRSLGAGAVRGHRR